MGNGIRQTFYFKFLDAIKKIAEEENIDVNGNTFEDIFFDRYLTCDINYKRILKNLYTQDHNLRQTIMNILDIMAYSSNYMQPDNVEFIKIVRDIIMYASWDNPTDNYTDYNLRNYDTRVYAVADILYFCHTKLSQRMDMANNPLYGNMQAWEFPVQDARYTAVLKNPDNYNEAVIEGFKLKEKNMRNDLEDSNITPARVLDLIIENWEYMWNFSTVYEAVQYCVTLSSTLQDKPQIRKKMRGFFQAISIKII